MRTVLVALALTFAAPAFGQSAVITRAWYDKDTDIYGHRIMGDIAEHLRLNAELSDGRVLRLDLGAGGKPTHVFEDMAPRLADMDRDGKPELLVVETDLTAGAALAIYAVKFGKLEKLAETPHIGRPYRWLAPVGAGDFNGDGEMDVAYVDRPHLARLLRIWTYDRGKLTEIGRASGLTNHRIGNEVIAGGVRRCDEQDQMVVLTADWSRIVVAAFDGGELKLRTLGRNSQSAMKKALGGC